jgi:hypothetical protein
MKRYIIVLTLFFINWTFPLCQEVIYYLNENFEEPSTLTEWISTPVDENIKWVYQTGGDEGYPLYAFEGDSNAIFHRADFVAVDRILESPPMDLSTASKPQLVFAHAQAKSFFGQDELRVLFKAGAEADWDTINPFYDSDYPFWEIRSYNIHEFGTKYLCEDFQVGFLATAKGGHGVCIDSVVIEEKDLINKFIKNSEVFHISHTIVPSGINEVPVICVYTEVFGNMDYMLLNEINFMSSGTDDNDFKTNGFKIYRTQTNVFKKETDGVSNQLGTAVSVSGGQISFSGLTDTLYTGDNYIWLTANISSNAGHNNIMDFSLAADGIILSDTTFPASQINPPGNFTIKESVLFDDFETSSGWDLRHDFEIAEPQGYNISSIAQDPNYAPSGNNVLGTDLTVDGAYKKGMTIDSAYYAISPLINLKYYKDIQLYANKWLSFNPNDEVTIDVSTNGGTSWTTIWDRKKDLLSYIESDWSEFHLMSQINDLTQIQENVKIRFTINESNPLVVYGGWNIDNFAIVGNHLETDVGITELHSPFDGCLNTDNDTIKVSIRNYAEGPSPTNIPIYYTLNGPDGQRYYDTIPGPIAQDDSIIFAFSSPVSFPGPGNYNFFISLDLAGDEDALNDTINHNLFIQNNLSLPIVENFETESGYWLPSSGSVWSCFEPTGGIPVLPESPNSWFVAPTGVYLNSDTTYIISNCYDLSSTEIQVIELKYWNESQEDYDGASIQYSIDDGENWILIDSTAFGEYSGWYTDSVAALGTIGWSGDSDGWQTVREYLPASLLSEPNVRFRVLWSTDETTSFGRGLIFDDFGIYTAPEDIGVSNILTPIDTCQFINTGSVSLEVFNYGVNKLNTSDTVIIGVDLDAVNVHVDTIILESDLLPQESIQVELEANLDLTTPKTYSLAAYTLNENDSYYYSATSNDTATLNFEVWAVPGIILPDTIGSRQPDTVDIKPIYPDWIPGYTYLWTPGNITDSIYDVSLNGYGDTLYKVTVKEPIHNCSSTDSVNVLLLYSDIGVDSILSPTSACELTDSEIIEVRIKNFGTDSVFSIAGDTARLVVAFQVEGDININRDTITVINPIRSGHTIQHSFSEYPYDFSSTGAYDIRAWAYFLGGDVNPDNDTTEQRLDAFGYSPIDIGADTVVPSLGITLDAGSVFTSYSWSTGDTTQTTFIDASSGNPSGNYFVDVVDINGCAGSDTINIWFKIRDVELYDIYSPAQTLCEPMDNLPLTVRIYNVGTDTIFTTDSINYSFRIDGGTTNMLRAAPDNDLVPGEQYTITLDNDINFSAIKDYIIEVTASAVGDLKTYNDSLADTTTTYPRPVVDLGDYPNPISGFEYLLDAGAGDYTYLWQDGITTSQTFLANSSREQYWVTVTDNITGCQGTDTTTILFDFLDFKIESIDGVGSQECRGEEKIITAYVANLGTQPRTDMSLTIGFFTNGGTPVYENHTFPGIFEPGTENSRSVELNNKASFDITGPGFIKVFVDHDDDIRNDDTLHQAVTVDASPIVDFGGDTLNVSVPYTLDAGDHRTYEWQDGFDGRYYTVSSTIPQLYTVIVTDEGVTCVTQESVYIEPSTGLEEFILEDFTLNVYPNPADEFINIEVINSSGDEILLELISITNQVIWDDMHNSYSRYTNKLDVSNLDKGVYFLTVRNKKYISTRKIIVN